MSLDPEREHSPDAGYYRRMASIAGDLAALAGRLAQASADAGRGQHPATEHCLPLPPAKSLDPSTTARPLEKVSREERENGLHETMSRLDVRRRELTKARRRSPYVNYTAPSNVPTDCDVWAADYRQQLAPGDPYRSDGPPLNVSGTREAAETLGAARSAVLAAINRKSTVANS